MSEIEKMYENAGVEKQEQGYCDWDSDCPYDMDKDCGKTCPYWVEEEPDYPPFTPEKQLELIKWFINFDYTHLRKLYGAKQNFAEVLSAIISYIWNSLTETERNEIRDILKG